jgi:MFS family permease
MSSASSAGAVSLRAMLNELLPIKNRGTIYGRYMAFVSLGLVVGPVIGGFFAENIGIRALFYFSGCLGALGVLILTFLKYEEPIEGKLSSSLKSQMKNTWAAFSFIKRPILIILLIRLFFMFNMFFRRGILPIILNESPTFRASESQIGVYFGVIMFSMALSQLFLGKLSDMVGSKKLMVFGLFMGGLSYQTLNLFQDLTPLYLIGVLQGIFFAASELGITITFMNIIPPDRSGKAMGIYGLSEDLGGIVASPTLGVIYDIKGSIFVVRFISGVLITIACISSALVSEKALDEEA